MFSPNGFIRIVRVSVVSAVCLVVGVTLSCTTQSVEPEVIGEGTYPAAVGTQWIYARYDSVRSSQDTITITITSSRPLQNGCMEHTARYKAGDTLRDDTLVTCGDTATWLSGNGYNSWITERYVFPLTVGNAWSASFEYDSVWVRQKNLLAVPAGEFYKTYQLERIMFFLNYSLVDRIWVAPGYGVIQKHVRRSWIEPDFREQNDVWTLIDYTIAE
ncbi:MAG: hypothetical protein RBT76_08270 [candidate division Zixibacteria bacterium]|jgi:hypothetical protein|nr:hypothetical protein [candidate division Zixibacteria bacterium]